MRSAFGLSALAIVALAAPTARADADDALAEGPHVVVRAIGGDERLAKQARDVVEASAAILEKRLGAPLPKGERLDVRVFVVPEAMTEALRGDGVPVVPGIFARTAFENLATYVAVEPTADAELLARIGGLPSFFRMNLVHECVHQWAARTQGRGIIAWPPWYAEGMANAIAYEALAAAAGKGAHPPVHADALVDLAQVVVARDDGLVAMLEARPERFRRRELYAVATDFYAWLGADAVRFARFRAGVTARSPKSDGEWTRERALSSASDVRDALVEAYGPLDALEARWRAALAAKRPDWRRVDGGGERVGDVYVFAAVTAWPVRQFRGDAPTVARFALAFDVDLGRAEDAQAAVYLGRRDGPDGETVLRLSFGRAGHAYLEARVDDGPREDLAQEAPLSTDAFPEGRFVPVRVDVEPRRVTFTVGGVRVAAWDLAEPLDASTGRWGFGANRGIASFRAPRVEPAK